MDTNHLGAPFNRRGWLVQSGDRKYVFRATPEPCLLITAHDTVLPRHSGNAE